MRSPAGRELRTSSRHRQDRHPHRRDVGTDAGNYILDGVTTTTAASPPSTSTGSFTAANKPYDGTTAATVLTRSPGAGSAGDAVRSRRHRHFAQGVGTGKTVTCRRGADRRRCRQLHPGRRRHGYGRHHCLHVTGTFTAANKPYDGTTAATVLTRSPGAVISGDVVALTGGTATFDTKAVGTGKTVTLSGAALTGADAGNYILDGVATTTADITALHVTGSFTAANKAYDGTTDATILTRSPGTVISGDAVALAGGTASFDTKAIGIGKTVTLTGASLAGADAGNYILDGVATTTASITALHVTGSFTAANKVYDGTTDATVVTRSPGSVVSGDAVALIGGTASFDSKAVGTGKTVTLSGASLAGADAGNYILDGVTTTTADITALHVTGSFTAGNKPYDSTTAATVLTRSPGAVLSGDAVALTGGTATFDTKAVGTAKTVTLAGATLTGADAGNYILDGVATTTADITALHVSGSFTAANKPYDGTTAASVLTRSPGAVISGDIVALSGGTATFDTQAAGTGKTVSLTGATLTGADAGNYVLDGVATTTANITALHVTGSFSADNKSYDGGTAATVLTRSPGA